MDLNTVKVASWSDLGRKNPLYTGEDKPLSERNNLAITIFIVLMVMILAWFILKSLKGLQLNKDSDVVLETNRQDLTNSQHTLDIQNIELSKGTMGTMDTPHSTDDSTK